MPGSEDEVPQASSSAATSPNSSANVGDTATLLTPQGTRSRRLDDPGEARARVGVYASAWSSSTRPRFVSLDLAQRLLEAIPGHPNCGWMTSRSAAISER